MGYKYIIFSLILVMQSVPEQFESPADRAEFHTIESRSGVELYRARIVQYAFAAHTHEAYTFGTITSGVQRIRCNGTEHLHRYGITPARYQNQVWVK